MLILYSPNMLVRIVKCGRRAVIAMNNVTHKRSRGRRRWPGACGAYQRKNYTCLVRWRGRLFSNWAVVQLAGLSRLLSVAHDLLALISPRGNSSMRDGGWRKQELTSR